MSLIRYHQSQKTGAVQQALEAVRRIDSARSELETLVGEFPEVPQYRRELAAVCQNLAEITIEDALDALAEKNVTDARGKLDRSQAYSATALKMIAGLKASARSLGHDELNQALATFDVHLREAWLRFVQEIGDGNGGKADLSPKVEQLNSDLKALEAVIERPPLIAGNDVKLASRYAAFSELLERIDAEQIPSKSLGPRKQ
jgi:hypothetical protein